jgi:adenosine deaminase
MKDLHLHLSGSTSPSLLFEIICETGIKIKEKNYWQFLDAINMKSDKINNLNDYIKMLEIIDETQSSPRAVELSFFDSYKNSFMSGCDYLELRWNPYKRSKGFKIDLDKLIVAAKSGFEKANSIFGINGDMILCMGRDCTEIQNEGIFKKAIQYFKKGIIGIDVAGPETTVPLKPEFEQYYKIANALGIMTTIHCGEPYYEGVENTLSTILDKYKPKRIGHGIQICKYPKLMKQASSMGVVFEICMTSNIMTKSVQKKEDFIPIFKAFDEYQIKYILCTDNLFAINTNISKEHKIYEELKDLSKKM